MDSVLYSGPAGRTPHKRHGNKGTPGRLHGRYQTITRKQVIPYTRKYMESDADTSMSEWEDISGETPAELHMANEYLNWKFPKGNKTAMKTGKHFYEVFRLKHFKPKMISSERTAQYAQKMNMHHVDPRFIGIVEKLVLKRIKIMKIPTGITEASFHTEQGMDDGPYDRFGTQLRHVERYVKPGADTTFDPTFGVNLRHAERYQKRGVETTFDPTFGVNLRHVKRYAKPGVDTSFDPTFGVKLHHVEQRARPPIETRSGHDFGVTLRHASPYPRPTFPKFYKRHYGQELRHAEPRPRAYSERPRGVDYHTTLRHVQQYPRPTFEQYNVPHFGVKLRHTEPRQRFASDPERGRDYRGLLRPVSERKKPAQTTPRRQAVDESTNELAQVTSRIRKKYESTNESSLSDLYSGDEHDKTKGTDKPDWDITARDTSLESTADGNRKRENKWHKTFQSIRNLMKLSRPPDDRTLVDTFATKHEGEAKDLYLSRDDHMLATTPKAHRGRHLGTKLHATARAIRPASHFGPNVSVDEEQLSYSTDHNYPPHQSPAREHEWLTENRHELTAPREWGLTLRPTKREGKNVTRHNDSGLSLPSPPMQVTLVPRTPSSISGYNTGGTPPPPNVFQKTSSEVTN